MQNGCPSSQSVPGVRWPYPVVVIHEDVLTLRAPVASAFGVRGPVLPALKEVLRRIQFAMMTTAHARYRRAVGGVGYLDTDYVTRRLRGTIPVTRAEQRAADVDGLEVDGVEAMPGRPAASATVGDLLNLGFAQLAAETGLSGAELVRFRRQLLGRTTPPDESAS
jgi:hypothetical protein